MLDLSKRTVQYIYLIGNGMILRENIKRLRDGAGLTVREAAKRGSLHEATWSDIERGKNPNPTPKTLERIAAALDCTLAELFVDADGESVTL